MPPVFHTQSAPIIMISLHKIMLVLNTVMMLLVKIKILIKDASTEGFARRCFCCRNPYFCSVIYSDKNAQLSFIRRQIMFLLELYFYVTIVILSSQGPLLPVL